MQKVTSKTNKNAYFYTAIPRNSQQSMRISAAIGDVIKLVPDSANYKTCRPISFRTLGNFIPRNNEISAQELISKYRPKTLCN